MKVTYQWLKQYVDFDWSPEELAERLTMLGLEVEGVDKVSGSFEGVVVAEVLSSEQHPNADRLSVCQVADGRGERQIVCGAKNYKVGDKVPLILPGSALPAKGDEEPFVIKVGKLRGIESQGMMCSGKELGLSDDAAGLMILPSEAPVGQSFAEFLGKAETDWVYDLEITPNRPDWNSVIGIAREISALSGNPLRLPEISLNEGETTAAELVDVRLDDTELCPRYIARVVRDVKIGPSPDWLRDAVEKIGIRSINNVVDVTNFVLMEIGQPLHAFDYHLLGRNGAKARPTVVVRRAAPGEKFITLDDQEHELSENNLLIADETRGIALAGVMGGQNTEINQQTVDVLLESAYFNPQNIRATSKQLDLRTDASYRFERGADVEIADWASRRAAQLILETAGGTLATGSVDAYPHPAKSRAISLRFRKTNELLGIEISAGDQVDFLKSLDLTVEGQSDDAVTVEIPTFRVDLKQEADLIEEIARLYGVDRIPSTPPRMAMGAHAYDAVHDDLASVRDLLIGLGLTEAQGQTFISDQSAKRANDSLAYLEHPLSSDMNVLRPSLLPGLLDALRNNFSRHVESVGLFEVGRVFLGSNGDTHEARHLALALSGRRQSTFWSGGDRDARYDLFDPKGTLESFIERLGIRGVLWKPQESASELYVESASIRLGKMTLGTLGQMQPILARQYDLKEPVFLAELNLDQLLRLKVVSKSFSPLPAFPAIRRDIAMLLPESTTHDDVQRVIKKTKLKDLEAVELFDIYRGDKLPKGRKSLAYAFTYRNTERTLTDQEVNQSHEKLVEQFVKTLDAEVR